MEEESDLCGSKSTLGDSGCAVWGGGKSRLESLDDSQDEEPATAVERVVKRLLQKFELGFILGGFVQVLFPTNRPKKPVFPIFVSYLVQTFHCALV